MANKITGFFWQKMPESSIKRLIRSYFYDKEKFLFKTSSDVFLDIYEGKTDLWAQEESKSGGGSTLQSTTALRKHLLLILEQYSIGSMLDTPCGDYNWMKAVPKKCTYTGGDIVAEMIENNQQLYASDNIQFKVIDITKDKLPKVDLIFCRECLQHLSDDNVKAALNNFKQSGSKYLLVSSYPKTWRNWDIYDGDYRALNLRKKPFSLPKPLLTIKEDKRGKYDSGFDKAMLLYDLSTIPFFQTTE